MYDLFPFLVDTHTHHSDFSALLSVFRVEIFDLRDLYAFIVKIKTFEIKLIIKKKIFLNKNLQLNITEFLLIFRGQLIQFDIFLFKRLNLFNKSRVDISSNGIL